ncbi:MAG: bacteriohemerythrin [Negativicutes bacterium]|nr:bacteriohemerythrin [Negativicutes bacterium]
MALIDWNNQLSVNVPALDAEHKKLVAMLNSLHDAMKTGKGRAQLPVLLNEATTYAVEHFAHEEQLMTQHGYPDFAAHKDAHEKFIKQVASFKEQMANNMLLTSEVLQVLRDWIVTHIGTVDKKYSPCLSAPLSRQKTS